MVRMDWTHVITREPQGYLELYNDQMIIHGPVESIEINYKDFVVIKLKWCAQAPFGGFEGLPGGRWKAIENDKPIIFRNLTVPYKIEETPENGTRVRFGQHFLYINPRKGINPREVVGLKLPGM